MDFSNPCLETSSSYENFLEVCDEENKEGKKLEKENN